MNEASGCDGIPIELFQILKDDAVKVLHSICQQIWKTQRWPQDWKMSVFIPVSKNGNTKETFHAKMGSIKDTYCRDLTEAEDIKKRWQEYTEELYKKRSSQPR